MSDIEESLLDSDEEEAPKPKRENSTIKQMREALEAREERLKALEERNAKYESTFLTQAGLTEKQANALRAAGYEANPEGIESFRADVLGVAAAPAPAEEPPVEQPEAVEEIIEPAAPQFQPTRAGGSAPTRDDPTSNELLELFEVDPVKADKFLREGRVKRHNFNPGGPAF